MCSCGKCIFLFWGLPCGVNYDVRRTECAGSGCGGINTISELVQRNQEDMMKVRNLGRKSLEEVEQKLEALGLSLRPSEE